MICLLYYPPQIQHGYPKFPYLKGDTFSKPSFWVSMLNFWGVMCNVDQECSLKQFFCVPFCQVIYQEVPAEDIFQTNGRPDEVFTETKWFRRCYGRKFTSKSRYSLWKLYNMLPLKISGWKTNYIPFEMP